MPNVARLGKGASKKVAGAIDVLFDNAKARLLGPQSIIGKKIYIGFHREMSLPGIFEAGSLEEMVKPDLDVLDSLIRVAGAYVDAHRERTKARVIHEINGAMAEARHNGSMSQADFRGLVNTKLASVWSDVTKNIHAVVDTELSHAKNVSVLDGVVGANLNAGIADPIVYFVVVRDNILCKECKRLHLMDDEKTPRLWFLSELGHGYHKKGEDSPKIGGLHPHCRCTLVTLLPGYGFGADGMVKFVKRGHLELNKQRGLALSEPEPEAPLAKAIGEIPLGTEIQERPHWYNPETKSYDYSHLLPEEHRTKGYSLSLDHHDKGAGQHFLEANLHLAGPPLYTPEEARGRIEEDEGREEEGLWDDDVRARYDRMTAPHKRIVGHALAHVNGDVLTPHFNDGVDPAHRGMKFGSALYSAIFAHAKNGLGAQTVRGGHHSVEAGLVHQSLSRQHGMDYSAKTLRIPKKLPEKSRYHLLRRFAPGAMKAKGPYQYALKSEVVDA
jgi:GNAT superfamily N-acetyltransferase